MNHPTSLPRESHAAATPSVPSTPAPAPSPARTFALDALRGFITFLVVVHHAVLAYHPHAMKSGATLPARPRMWQVFPIVDPERWTGIDLLVGFNDNFFMSLMFLISGLFVIGSLERKGPGPFIRERTRRLGIPFAVAAALLGPVSYFPSYLVTTAEPSLTEFWTQWTALGSWPAGPAWFLWVLLAFGLVAAAAYRLSPSLKDTLARFISRFAERPAAFCVGLTLASAAVYLPVARFFPNDWSTFGPFAIQTARVFHYALYFGVGLALGAFGVSRGLLAPAGTLARRWMRWQAASQIAFAIAIATFILFILGAQKGEPSAGLQTLMNLGYTLSCSTSCLAFLALFLRFAQQRNAVFASLSANAFGIYLLHYPLVSWLQYSLLSVNLPGFAKGGIVIAGALAASWLLTAGMRRVPRIGRFL